MSANCGNTSPNLGEGGMAAKGSAEMRKTMLGMSWVVFLAFVGLSGYANWMHGVTPHAKFMLAVMPIGFAASIFVLEGIISHGKASAQSYLTILPVTLCSGVASYIGLFGMARDNGIGDIQAGLMPLAFDGVVLVASTGIRAFSLSQAPRVQRAHRGRSIPADKQVDKRGGKPVDHRGDMSTGHVDKRTDKPVDKPTPDTTSGVRAIHSVPSSGDWDRALAAELLEQGKTYPEVASAVGKSAKTIQRFAKSRENGSRSAAA